MNKDPDFVARRGPLSILNPDLISLIQAMFEKGAKIRLEARGFSMSPSIHDGDIVTLSPFSNGKIGLGRIVALIHPVTQKLLIHRIVGEEKNTGLFIIKGDMLTEIDCLVPRSNLLGYVSKVERGKRNISFDSGPQRFTAVFLSKHNLFPFLLWLWKFIPAGIREKAKLIRWGSAQK